MELPYEIVYLGLEHPDFFQGFGTSGTKFEHSCYGIGPTIQDAYEDAAQQMYCSEQVSSIVLKDMPEICPIPNAKLEDDDLRYYHVGIRWVNCSVGELNPEELEESEA